MNKCYDYDYKFKKNMEDSTSQEKLNDVPPIDWGKIAQSGAEAVNGQNGAEFCKTIRHCFYCILLYSALHLCLNAIRS